jgi:hypothetical protein
MPSVYEGLVPRHLMAAASAPIGASPAATAADAIVTFSSTIGAGDQYLAAGEWDNAVEAYKAAGNTGTTLTGPAIDKATNLASQPSTQQAWSINKQLNTINSGPYNGVAATQTDAKNAQSLVNQMLVLYRTALSAPPPAPPSQMPQLPGGNTTWMLVGAIVLVVIGAGRFLGARV